MAGCLCELGSERKSAMECRECQPGKYRGNYSQTTCSECPAGTYSTLSGASLCTNCPAGFFSHSGSTGCSVCAAGSYGQDWGLAQCQLCPQGTYSSALAATSPTACETCGTGSTTGSAGSTTQKECLSFASGQERFCSAGKVCSITGLMGRALQNNSLMLITTSDCDAAKLPVQGIVDDGISLPAGNEGTSYQWGSNVADFTPAGDIYQLCFCANFAQNCQHLDLFLLPAGALLVRGPTSAASQVTYECTRGSLCNQIELEGYELQESDRVAVHRGGCGSPDSTQHFATAARVTMREPSWKGFGNLSRLALDFSTILFDPEDVGYSLCWCAVENVGDCQDVQQFNVAAGKLRLMGAYGGQASVVMLLYADPGARAEAKCMLKQGRVAGWSPARAAASALYVICLEDHEADAYLEILHECNGCPSPLLDSQKTGGMWSSAIHSKCKELEIKKLVESSKRRSPAQLVSNAYFKTFKVASVAVEAVSDVLALKQRLSHQELGTQMDLQLVLLPFADVAEAPARVLLNAAREGNAAEVCSALRVSLA
ncbi:ANKRD50 [Symbiodinium natans]|uniref:ANKRD50 protein n=1 Tax=Symbiodinium natans TaxID=878477 RepID=A0A812MT10_9DINO|nr:ANKRD50 [Symbiodinium natans]